MELSNIKNSNHNKNFNIKNATYFYKEIDEREKLINFLNENIKFFTNDINKNKKTEIINTFFELFLNYFNKLFYLRFSDKNDKNKFLYEMIEYSVISSGKKLRPIFIFINSYLFDFYNIEIMEHFLLSIEMIHVFSLIHDDLPAIDNDVLRRGKESTWKKFGEGYALLTGDSLLAEAFNNINCIKNNIAINTSKENYNDFFEIIKKIDMANFLLSDLTGNNGMILGELLDVYYTDKNIDIDSIKYMYDKKTGSLILSSFMIGIILSKNTDNKNIDLIKQIANDVGFSYQLIDDLLEIIGDEEKIGKKINSDIENKKITYVSKIGEDKAKEKIKKLNIDINKNIDSLKNVDINKLNFYKFFINYIMDRDK